MRTISTPHNDNVSICNALMMITGVIETFAICADIAFFGRDFVLVTTSETNSKDVDVELRIVYTGDDAQVNSSEKTCFFRESSSRPSPAINYIVWTYSQLTSLK